MNLSGICFIYMLVPICAKSPYVYRHQHTGMGPHTCTVIFFDTEQVSLINKSWRWNLTLEINTNTKIVKDSGQPYGQTYYTATQGFWIHGLRLHTMRAVTVHANDCKKVTRTTKQRDIDTERQTYRHIRSTGTQWGSLDPSVGNIGTHISMFR